MNSTVSLTLSREQLQSAAALLNKKPAVFSPLQVPEGGAARRVTNPKLVDGSGQLLPDVVPMMQTLLEPGSAAGFTAVSPEVVIDLEVLYPAAEQDADPVMLTSNRQDLVLESPAPLERALFDLMRVLTPYKAEPARKLEASLSLVGGLTFFALLDLLRPEEGKISVDAIRECMNAPMLMLANLAAYAREKLNLAVPTRDEIIAALDELNTLKLCLHEDDSVIPGKALTDLAQDLRYVRAHCQIFRRFLKLNRPGEQLYNFIQGASGNGLLWYEAEGQVTVEWVSTPDLLRIAEILLVESYTGALNQ